MFIRLAIVAILFLVPASLLAQGTVTIFGTVQDGSGAVIPGAEITVTNTATGAVRNTQSSATGDYVVPQLPIGIYRVRVQAEGFKAFVQDNIAVQVDENRQVTAVLEVGSMAESVEVAAELVQVETHMLLSKT